MTGSPRIWVLADDRAGNANQALGVAEALGLPFAVREIRYGLLSALPNVVLGASTLGLTQATRAALKPPWPDLVIAAGRRTAPVALWLKRRQPQAFLVQLMWPGMARGFDLIAMPEHDQRGERATLVRTLGAPHRITPERLAEAAQDFEGRVAHLPKPRIVCLVGGTSRHGRFKAADAEALGARVASLAASRGGSLLITTSRRTGADCERALERAIAGVPHWLHRYSAGGGENPYLGFLASADAVVVTGDSTSMCTEACATGRPVFLYPLPGATPAKHARLHARLAAQGYVLPLDAPWPEMMPPSLYPQRTVAEAIRARFPAAERARSAEALASAAATL